MTGAVEVEEATIQGRRYVNPPLRALLDLHDELLAEHGGAPGLRDPGGLESSLARPYQLIAYGDDTLYWPSRPAAHFQLEQLSHGETPGGYFYAANRFCTA